MSEIRYQHVTTAWECNHCSEVHDTEDEALECCPARPTAGYQCVACGEWSTEMDDLAHCCEAADAEADAPTDVAMTPEAWAARMQALETAGQGRLLP